ncbi:metal-dependent hydrolase, beta-lactamase superfamily I [Aequorivita sublithincola DSM 14238]|uniref:Metal-dependent hydrolase, beta-lactamase superfamily I n=1 Tax=Aequorivita sublithincola (strain DSM 14238 / LMG 21431 / ACAM 643 / 9-3) TaxID=746697 RepID=I3YZ31_AEQSU|nr:MBL fold metallo-hydrolase [Aequorivita sublithincola]AFL82249.1 metal-dependent hydrolase, beta-lactamase superfamily I [Aequorivita sublithincola DSM 14238]
MNSTFTVTFLGTGTSQGIPVIGSDHPVCKSTDPKDKRLRVSVLLRWDDYTFVIDCGPDFRQQMLRENVSKVDAILLTHEHSDHTAGLDDIRPFNFKQGNMPFYSHKRVFESLRDRFAYIFATENKYPGAPSIEQIEIDKNTLFVIGGKKVIPIEAFHDKLPVLGFRVEDFTYLTDVKTISEEEIEKVKGTKILVINALREEPHYSHFNISEALDFVEKVKPKKTYFTHISHVMGFHKEVEKRLPKNVHLAYDTLTIKI